MQLRTGGMYVSDAYAAKLRIQQRLDHLLVAGLIEKVPQRTRDFAADVGYALEQRPGQTPYQFQIAEPGGQRLGRAFANMFDAQRKQETFERGLPAEVDSFNQVLCPLGGHLAGANSLRRGAIPLVGAPLHFQQVFELQLVKISH